MVNDMACVDSGVICSVPYHSVCCACSDAIDVNINILLNCTAMSNI